MYCVHVPGQIPCEQEPAALGAVHPGLHVPQGARPARVGQGHVGGGPQGHGGAGGVLGGGVDGGAEAGDRLYGAGVRLGGWHQLPIHRGGVG